MPTGWISSLIGGSFDILGGGLNALYSADAASKAYKRQVKILQMQQNWQERMANTAHQREVKDLRAAGLNPILSATGGNGASSPVVTAPSVSQAHGNPFSFNNLGKTLQSSAEAKQADAADKQAEAADKLADARIKNEARIATSQVKKNDSEAKYLDQQTRNLKAREGNIKGPFGMEFRGSGIDAMAESVVKAWEMIEKASPDNIVRELHNTKSVREFKRNLNRKSEDFGRFYRNLEFLRRVYDSAPFRDRPDSLFDKKYRSH